MSVFGGKAFAKLWVTEPGPIRAARFKQTGNASAYSADSEPEQ